MSDPMQQQQQQISAPLQAQGIPQWDSAGNAALPLQAHQQPIVCFKCLDISFIIAMVVCVFIPTGHYERRD